MKNNTLTIGIKTRKRKKFRSIKTKIMFYFVFLFLVILITISLVDIWGVPFTPYNGMQGLAKTESFRSLNLIADIKEDRLLRWITERRGDIRLFTDSDLTVSYVVELLTVIGKFTDEIKGSSGVWDLLRQEKSYTVLLDHLNKTKNLYGMYYKIQIADAKTGLVFVSTDETALGKNISQQLFFSKTLHSEYDYIHPIRLESNRQSQKPVLLIGHVIKSPKGNIVAVLFFEIETESILKPMLHTGEGLGKNGEALLVNNEAIILTSLKHPLPSKTAAKPLEYQNKAEPAVRAARGEAGIMEAVDYRGEPVLAAYRYIQVTPEWGWGMVVKRDESELFAPLKQSKVYTFLIGLAAISVFTWLTVILAGKLTQPIQALSKTAEKVAGGDFDARAPVTTADEVGILAEKFNVMVESINTRTLELEVANKKLTAENTAHMLTKAVLQRKNQNQSILNRILTLSLEPYELKILLEHIIDVILEIPWIPLTKTAAVFIVGKDPVELILTAHRGLSSEIVSQCARLPFGKCVCGLTAESKKAQFISCLNNQHDIHCETMLAHNHYCVPILSKARILGVVNLYLTEKHQYNEEEKLFLQAIANILAGIIERKEMEGQLKEYSQSLEQMIEERTQALQQAQQDLVRKEKLAAVGQLASSVSHELRNPLGVIGNSAYYLNMKLTDADEKVKKHVRILQHEVQRSNKIISDLLDFSRATLPSLKEVEINHIVRSALHNLNLPENISLTTRLPGGIPVVFVDPGQMEQVFQNIILNAVQAMPAGGKLEIITGVKDNFAEIMFKDSGEGIPTENLPKIFEPLYTTKTIGTGLGLAIVKSIIDKHKGRISVESKPGKGSTFTVMLELALKA